MQESFLFSVFLIRLGKNISEITVGGSPQNRDFVRRPGRNSDLLDNNPRAGGAKLSPIQFELVFIVTIQQM